MKTSRINTVALTFMQRGAPFYTPFPPRHACTGRIQQSARLIPRRSQHGIDTTGATNLVLIGTASFVNDVVHAVQSFMKAGTEDKDLRTRVEARLPTVLQTFPIKV